MADFTLAPLGPIVKLRGDGGGCARTPPWLTIVGGKHCVQGICACNSSIAMLYIYMPPRLPLMAKTPFVLDQRPLTEATSAHAGLLATSRAFRSLGYPQLIEENLKVRKRRRGFSEAQMIESIVLLQTLGGECPEDIGLLAHDRCLERGLGYAPAKVTAVREFLQEFHEEELEALRPPREEQKSLIFPSSGNLEALQEVQAAGVARIAEMYQSQGQQQKIATIDQDATIIESHKKAAYSHYKGGRGYQPMLALWAEADLVVADEFRDGNVPAAHRE